MILLCIIVGLQFFTLAYMIYLHVRARHVYANIRTLAKNMDCDDLLDQLLGESPTPEPVGVTSNKRARLAALVVGGQAKMTFKGNNLTAERVDQLTDAEVVEALGRYEARLGAAMSKSLGGSLIRLYASAASMLLPLPSERQPALVADLEEDPFVSAALSSACCELYYRYGMYLAPLTAALTTAKHCEWHAPVEVKQTNSTNDGTGDGTSNGAPGATQVEEP